MSSRAGWEARLELSFEADAEGVTRLVHNRHQGPLRLLRALPQSDGSSHAVLVHPPGGLVGGDTLDIDIRIGAGARVLCTTPGAQKWYRAERPGARARTTLKVAEQAVLAWLPQPTLVFDSARADQVLEVDLAPEASMFGWEALVLGRAAMGEQFSRGRLQQALRLRQGGHLLWDEQAVADAGDRLFLSPLGWGGRIAACTVWACAPVSCQNEVLGRWREAIDTAQEGPTARAARLVGAATQPAPGLLAARLLSDDAEPLMHCAEQLRVLAAPLLSASLGQAPRIWAT
ncbi:MAG: urease accessory protein UreD [Burkholderiaceae bacterium]